MMRASNAVFAALLAAGAHSASANVVISEIAYKGTGSGVCEGRDWVELYNEGAEDFDLGGYKLHDDKGFEDEDAQTFAEGTGIAAGEYLLLCRDGEFQFGIGADDTVSLASPSGIPMSSVALPGTSGDDGAETYALIGTGYEYTGSPTPGEANVYTKPISREEKLRLQNLEGKDFFALGEGSDDTFTDVVDVYVTVPQESLTVIADHPGWEEWVPFDTFSVSNVDEAEADAIAASMGGGRIRVKGQSTNTITACMGLRNVPFNVEFDTPFLGMENLYLRNHLSDFSYMREHASHVMLKAFGLPYARTRPVRFFLNGQYTGFYTLMEAPTQGYVMQRSFGAFDPDQTAIFKSKTFMTDCPFEGGQAQMMLNAAAGMGGVAANVTIPSEYYFERGEHRRDTPVLGRVDACLGWFVEEIAREQADVYRGFVDNGMKCGKAMVELGRVDRDFGPKSMEEPMISFLDEKFFNEDVKDLNEAIDSDQWLRNFATYTIMLNLDSPISNTPNNWYIAGTQGGYNGDWKIVQYDHNNIATRDLGSLCEASCGPRLVYWPILRPTCRGVEQSKTVGRILNSDENVQKYLKYVQEYVEILETEGIVDQLYDYGHVIKEYVQADPFFNGGTSLDLGAGVGGAGYADAADYERNELARDTEGYNSPTSPFLKTFTVRLEQVQQQLNAIEDGTLPRNGEYDPAAVCPDWRDSQSEDYLPGSTVAEDCALDFCKDAGACYENSPFTCFDGNLVIPECQALSPTCDACFPYSQCGIGRTVPSNELIESAECPAAVAEGCAMAAPCFDHMSGQCAYDGTLLTVECQAATACKACFPNSRCAQDDFVPAGMEEDDNKASIDQEYTPELPIEDNGEPEVVIETDSSRSSSSATSTAVVASWMLLALTILAEL